MNKNILILFHEGFMTIPRTLGEYVVAFSASRTTPPGDRGPFPVAFNEVDLNIGDDFNPTTGTFLCRIPGVYLFTVSAGANKTGGRSSCRFFDFIIPSYIINTRNEHHQFRTKTTINTLNEHHQFRTKTTISVISDVLKSMGEFFQGFFP